MDVSTFCVTSKVSHGLMFSVNDFSDFQRPESYIRYIGLLTSYPLRGASAKWRFLEPLEIELMTRVEYDMDEQGECKHVISL